MRIKKHKAGTSGKIGLSPAENNTESVEQVIGKTLCVEAPEFLGSVIDFRSVDNAAPVLPMT